MRQCNIQYILIKYSKGNLDVDICAEIGLRLLAVYFGKANVQCILLPKEKDLLINPIATFFCELNVKTPQEPRQNDTHLNISQAVQINKYLSWKYA